MEKGQGTGYLENWVSILDTLRTYQFIWNEPNQTDPRYYVMAELCDDRDKPSRSLKHGIFTYNLLDITPCRIGKEIPTFRRNMLPPSLGPKWRNTGIGRFDLNFRHYLCRFYFNIILVSVSKSPKRSFVLKFFQKLRFYLWKICLTGHHSNHAVHNVYSLVTLGSRVRVLSQAWILLCYSVLGCPE